MIRTKHLFVCILSLILVVLAVGIWSLCTKKDRVSSGIQDELLLGETPHEYTLVPKNEDTREKEREAFIAKIRSALSTEHFEEPIAADEPVTDSETGTNDAQTGGDTSALMLQTSFIPYEGETSSTSPATGTSTSDTASTQGETEAELAP